MLPAANTRAAVHRWIFCTNRSMVHWKFHLYITFPQDLAALIYVFMNAHTCFNLLSVKNNLAVIAQDVP